VQVGQLGIAAQPVLLAHVVHHRPGPLRHPFALRQKLPIDIPGEVFELPVSKARPVPRQQMIVEHVNQNPGETPTPAADSGLALQHQRMGVGKAVDPPVQNNTLAHRFRQFEPVDRSFYKVAQHAAQRLFRRLRAQQQVREEIHQLPST